jgi:putative oxidoreductase
MITSTTSRLAHFETKVHTDVARWLVPVGRFLFVAIFLMSVPSHFSNQTIDMASQHGVPMANVLVPLSGILALVGGLSVLVGYHAEIGAFLLAAFLVPVTLTMHDFWAADAAHVEMQRIMFMKNVAMFGATLMLMYFGAGPVSLDSRSRHID